jgi:LPS-assembly lipoprotein
MLRSGNRAPALARAVLAFALAGAVAGCFQPLYGHRSPTGGSALRESLSGVAISQIDAPANSREARLAVQIQNELRFKLTGGSGEARPTHQLKIQISGSRAVVSATNVTGLPINENFVLGASYTLIELASGRTVLTGRATTTVSYDPAGTQRFARIGGALDAERRAAEVISENVTTRLASYFASGT